MAKPKLLSLPDVSQWQVQVLRLTAFPSPLPKADSSMWWKELLGTEAESRNVRPLKGELTEQGSFEKGVLILQTTPLRIDWNLGVNIEAELDSDNPRLPTLGSFPEVADKFVKLMTAWLSSATVPSLQRLAFGAVLRQPVGSHNDGYKLLGKYLPSIDLSPESRDFFYQINRVRKSKVPQVAGLPINRLNKWGCVTFQRSLFQQQADGKSRTHVVGDASYECSLELDISSDANFTNELPKECLEQLYREMYNLGRDIASRGDIS